MRHKECAFTKCTQGSNEKRHLLTIFKAARNTFDKSLRNAERAHRRDLSINIETVCTDNPRQFWDHLRSLGPRRKHEIPLEVYDDQRNIISDSDRVFDKWSDEFSSLYNPECTDDQFDQQCYDRILQHKRLLEDNMLDPLYQENVLLNYYITRCEVERVVYGTKKKPENQSVQIKFRMKS